MGTTNAVQVRDGLHLIPCPYCAADNGSTARSCWRCEAVLTPRPQLGDPDLPCEAAPAETSAPDMPHTAGEPSFFPVLRDELEEQPSAANDDASPDLASIIQLRQRAADRKRTLMLAGASLGLCAVLLGWYHLAPPPSATAPSTATAIATAPAPSTVVASADGVAPPAPPVAPATDDIVKVQAAYTRPTPVQPATAPPAAELPGPQAIASVSARPPEAAPERAVRRPAAVSTKRRPTSTRRADSADSAAAPPPAPCTAEVVALGLCGAVSR